MNNRLLIYKISFSFFVFIIGSLPLNGQVPISDSIHINSYRSEECGRALEAIGNSMPNTAIEIMQNLQKKYILNNLENCVLAQAYNNTHAYEKTKELYKSAKIIDVNNNNYLFVLLYIKALSETKEYREAISLREKVIVALDKTDNNKRAILSDVYFDMAGDYIKIDVFEVGRKWMDKAILFRMNVLNVDINKVAKGEIIDRFLASYFAGYYVNMVMYNPIEEDNELYLALSIACGNEIAKYNFPHIGKNYKKILKKFLKKNISR